MALDRSIPLLPVPPVRDVNEADNCPSAVTYQRHFGSWNAAKEAAGLQTIEEDQTPVEYTDAELCSATLTLPMRHTD